MNNVLHKAIIIGNGKSRSGYDLKKIGKSFITFGCNLIVEEFHPTYAVVIDEQMLLRLQHTDYPPHRILAPPEFERWEPQALHPDGARFRSNAGMNAMCEAMKRGFKHLYLLGMDFILKDEAQFANVYAGQPGYESTLTPNEAMGRVRYFEYIAKNNLDIWFSFVFPQDVLDKGYHPVPENVDLVPFDLFMTFIEGPLVVGGRSG